jgi:hypothetical protein
MTAVGLVVLALIVIGSMIALVLLVIITNGLIEAHRDRLEPSLGDVREAILAAVSGEESTADEIVGSETESGAGGGQLGCIPLEY